MTIIGTDGLSRCFGGQAAKESYGLYHDSEWGRPSHDERYLFEMLILEGAQAGLSWETILKRREGYRRAFYGFDPQLVAKMTDEELEALCANPEIVRHRQKIFSARQNAQAFLAIQRKCGSFDRYLWAFVDGQPIVNSFQSFSEVPSKTPQSDALAKDLKRRGMLFVGSTIIYAYMQAVGLVDDHLQGCHCRKMPQT
jgi:DNA-3-methyladenine glycosylase I